MVVGGLMKVNPGVEDTSLLRGGCLGGGGVLPATERSTEGTPPPESEPYS